jgi:hypothetical protein
MKRRIKSHKLRFLAVIQTTSFEVWLKWICFMLKVLQINMARHSRRLFGDKKLNMDVLDWNQSIQTIPDFESQYRRILKRQY